MFGNMIVLTFDPRAGRLSTGDITTSPTLTTALRIPKNKSTGNLLSKITPASANPSEGRTRFSFDAGSAQELSNLKRYGTRDRWRQHFSDYGNRTTRTEHDNVLGVSGLRRIRRPGPPSRQSTIVFDETEFIASPLQSTHTLPLPKSSATSRSVSRSASTTNFFPGGPTSPVVEDLHRFPSESLHSFSFARQTEDFLHSRHNILQKSVEFMQDRPAWAINSALANAQARISGDAEIQGMMDLLRRAKVVPALDIEAAQRSGLGLGPVTGPADFEGRNIFEKSFGRGFDTAEVSPRASTDDALTLKKDFFNDRVGDEMKEELGQRSDTPPVPGPKKFGLKRTYTDTHSVSLQQKLMEALAQPYSSEEQQQSHGKDLSTLVPSTAVSSNATLSMVHSHSSKWVPSAQAVFRTSADAPWTIVAANDLACLTFGVTRAEVRSLSILGIIQKDRRNWLEKKLERPMPVEEKPKSPVAPSSVASSSSSMLGSRSGITARLLSKAPSRNKSNPKAQADDRAGGDRTPPLIKNHPPTKSRGVLLCGDVLPIQKRDGTLGTASFWLMEKKGGFIWVIEEVTEDIAYLTFDEKRKLASMHGDVEPVWGEKLCAGLSLKQLIPQFPYEALYDLEYDRMPLIDYFTAHTLGGVNVPIAVAKGTKKGELRISSLPHIAGVMVIDPQTLKIKNSNAVFSAALFGYDIPNGLPMSELIPNFDDLLNILTEEDDHELEDGLVIPEHSFRKARALLALREGKEDAANLFLRPSGLPAKHKDGSDIMVDMQMRVVRSETVFPATEDVIEEEKEDIETDTRMAVAELVYAVWITYSRQLHSAGLGIERPDHPLVSRPVTPPTQPPPLDLPSPPSAKQEVVASPDDSQTSLVDSSQPMSPVEPIEHPPAGTPVVPHEKKTINDFSILEEMGKGAYGEVKLARYKKSRASKVVLKYVIKKRILVDTWTRDRRLGTVPLEIHVLDYLRNPGMKHPNIVEMIDFFEDNANYYIEMLPHGIPGMDLFDYIELRSNMEELECRNIFRQVVEAIHHLHMKARVVHRDIKDENVVLDGEGQVKLIDFGSAAYIKNGPFDVFVGTLGKITCLTSSARQLT